MDEDPGPLVRPYVMTGGRTSPAIGAFDLISIVMAACQPQGHDGGLEPEAAQILRHCQRPTSVAELSAHTRLPLGVVRVLVTDLAEENYLRIHTGGTAQDATTHDESGGLSLSVLESVLDGIAAL